MRPPPPMYRVGSTTSQTANVSAANNRIAGAKYDATLSANSCIFAFSPPEADIMMPTIWPSCVAAPVVSHAITRLPSRLWVPATTLDPDCFGSGVDSPVSIDSSTLETP